MENLDFLMERKILKLGNLLISTRNKDLKAFDLTSNQSETLLFFDSHSGATITDLKDHLNVSHQAAQKIVERMKERQLLRIAVSPQDARAKNVFLTEQGQQSCSLLKSKGTDVGKNLFHNLSQEEKETLFFLLDKIE